MPFSSLTDVNFLYCLHCRHKEQQNNAESPALSSSSAPSPVAVFSPCLLDAFFHEYSAAVASKASRRAPREYAAANSLKRSSKLTVHMKENKEGIDDHDVEEEGDALTMTPTETSTIQSIPLHLLFGDAVLSRVPLCDIVRARFVSRAWMTNIDAVLQNPTHPMHQCLHHPCLMLLNPASKTIGDCACLSVYDVSLNTWLPKPILFPSNAFYLVGASCGLFCFATGNPFIDNNVDFFVGNPLIHAWTCLPRPPVIGKKHTMVGVAFVAHEASPRRFDYKLLKLVRLEWKTCSIVYDSCKRKWDKARLPCYAVEHIVRGGSGLLHFFDRPMCNFWSYDLHTNKVQENQGVVVQDRRLSLRSVVESHPLQSVKVGLGLPSVVKCAERLFKVYRMHTPGYECAVVGLIPLISHSWPVGICRLENNAWWEFVSQVPPNLLREAVEEGSDGTDFVIGSDDTQHIFFG